MDTADAPTTNFPAFVATRRKPDPDHGLFVEGNVEREALAKQAKDGMAAQYGVVDCLVEAAQHACLPQHASQRHACSECGKAFASQHVLHIHVAEVHDAFFAAQAARRMKVFECLVEGCGKMFCSAQERKQHLIDAHRFPRNFDFERMHLRQRTGQQRPMPQHRRKPPRSADAASVPSHDKASSQPHDNAAVRDAAMHDTTSGHDAMDVDNVIEHAVA